MSAGAGQSNVKKHAEAVVLSDDQVLIRDLSVDGVLAELVTQATGDGRDPETVVRQALQIGAAILLHGTNTATIEAVSSHVDRLLAALDEKSYRIEALGRMREKVSAAKGLGWEASLAPAIDACFAPHGDEVEATGATRGIADDLVGDYVVTLNPRDSGGRDRKIVFECKARSPKGRPTIAKALEELEDAKLNRGAQVAVMLFPSTASSPLKGKPLRVFHGQRILAVYDPDGLPGSELSLEVGAQVARAMAIASGEREDLGLDRRMLAEKLDGLTNIIERGVNVKRGISTAKRGLTAAEDAYEQLAEEAMAVVLELMDRL
jgi:hypothetical protein